MQIVSLGDNLHGMSYGIFWENIRKNIGLSSAKLTQRIVRVK